VGVLKLVVFPTVACTFDRGWET